jgi:hypothetical protein
LCVELHHDDGGGNEVCQNDSGERQCGFLRHGEFRIRSWIRLCGERIHFRIRWTGGHFGFFRVGGALLMWMAEWCPSLE